MLQFSNSMMIAWIVLIHLFTIVNGDCEAVEDIYLVRSKIKTISYQNPLIRLGFPFQSPAATTYIDFTSDNIIQSIIITTYPPLTQGEDFEIYSYAKENSLPLEYRRKKQMYIGLKLLPGKQWIKNIENKMSKSNFNNNNNNNNISVIENNIKNVHMRPFYLVSIHVCPLSKQNIESISKTIDLSKKIQIAIITSRKPTCPTLPPLPGILPHVQVFIDNILFNCQNPRIIKTNKLEWQKFNSFALLSLQPPLLLIDGTSESIFQHAKEKVDDFLAAHAVLHILWEPYTELEPHWWILVPHLQGIPGHLFGMLDYLQWRHRNVSDATIYRYQPLCTNHQPKGCKPGCQKTKLVGITGSGWGADTFHIYHGLRRSFFDFEPIQASPVTLGYRASPPLWGGTIGWSYTYQGCDSHFLDCYFLKHSPCPRIALDIHQTVNNYANINPNRLTFRSENDKWPRRPIWWSKVMGTPSKLLPEYIIQDIESSISNQIFYSYIFRPKYEIRQIIYEKMAQFHLNTPCAVMHVRRGDSIMHEGQARSYIRIFNYMNESKAILDYFKIQTIFLVTDSQGAINEADICAQQYPEICKNIKFQYLQKKRWIGAEGGWENPFPSGNSRTEFLDIQLEFALSQKCSLLISGDSNYAEMIKQHMSCGFPLSSRGSFPRRCIAPPHIQLHQSGFSCSEGNQVACTDANIIGGDITKPLTDPSNMLAANMSFKDTAFRKETRICLRAPEYSRCYVPSSTSKEEYRRYMLEFVEKAKETTCLEYESPYPSSKATRHHFC